MAFSPDDQFLATGDGHGGCAIWNVKTGALVKSSDKHKRKITAIEFTSDGKEPTDDFRLRGNDFRRHVVLKNGHHGSTARFGL